MAAAWLGLAALAMASAAVAEPKTEIVTAATHAELAAGSADIAGIHMHLHHTLNCLVGPKGRGFDAKELNPCVQSGSGALPDTTDATRHKALEAAADKARAGIAASDMTTARQDATQTASLLKAVK
jgi:hypothetical protein